MTNSKLADLFARDRNNFDLIRLVAALSVMVGHSFFFRAPVKFSDPITSFTHLEYSGSLAVYAFFLLSGMLITASADRNPSPLKFCTLRFARLWPGLICNVLFGALIVGPLFTTLPVDEYLHSPVTHQYLARNLTLFDDIGFVLPGVFSKAPSPELMNPALWTLPMELYCYVIVLLFSVVGLLRNRAAWIVGCVAAFGLFMWGTQHADLMTFDPAMFRKNGGYSFYPPAFFLLGMILYVVRDRVALDWRVAAGLCAAYLAARGTAAATPLFYAAFTYGLLTVAGSTSLKPLRPKHDYSYGIYIYGFTAQQITLAMLPSLSGYLNLLVSVPLVLLLAGCSWHLIERPALKWVRRSANPPRPNKSIGGNSAATKRHQADEIGGRA